MQIVVLLRGELFSLVCSDLRKTTNRVGMVQKEMRRVNIRKWNCRNSLPHKDLRSSNPVASFRAYSTGAGLANSDKLAAG
jgi:hypothetical protein